MQSKLVKLQSIIIWMQLHSEEFNELISALITTVASLFEQAGFMKSQTTTDHISDIFTILG